MTYLPVYKRICRAHDKTYGAMNRTKQDLEENPSLQHFANANDAYGDIMTPVDYPDKAVAKAAAKTVVQTQGMTQAMRLARENQLQAFEIVKMAKKRLDQVEEGLGKLPGW